MEQLKLDPNAVVAFVDDTGHEELAEGHTIYGLGGCATLAGNLGLCIQRPWREIRRRILGSPDAALHASEISRKLSRNDQALIGRFFDSCHFMRFAVVATVKTRLPDPLVLLDVIAPSLMKRLEEIIKWTDAPSLSVLFESNERADPLIQRYFSPIKVERASVNIPVEWGFMPKQTGEPALEVADFIMHAVHGLAWDDLNGRNRFSRKDFRVIFQRKNTRLSSFMLIDNVQMEEPHQQAVPA